MNDKIICRVLTGPTASGKTEIGVRLAREQGWDIICMDSMQIYRHMDIGTAKPPSSLAAFSTAGTRFCTSYLNGSSLV